MVSSGVHTVALIFLCTQILNSFFLQEVTKVSTVFDREEVDPGKVFHTE